MSMFGMGGGGGSSTNYVPQATPFPPMRGDDGRDPASRARTRDFYTAPMKGQTYLSAIKGHGTTPVKSYTAQLFGGI